VGKLEIEVVIRRSTYIYNDIWVFGKHARRKLTKSHAHERDKKYIQLYTYIEIAKYIS